MPWMKSQVLSCLASTYAAACFALFLRPIFFFLCAFHYSFTFRGQTRNVEQIFVCKNCYEFGIFPVSVMVISSHRHMHTENERCEPNGRLFSVGWSPTWPFLIKTTSSIANSICIQTLTKWIHWSHIPLAVAHSLRCLLVVPETESYHPEIVPQWSN